MADPPRTLALAGDENNTRWSWTFILELGEGGTTRLISRNRLRITNPLARGAVLFTIDGPAGIMTVAMLHGVRRRVETHEEEMHRKSTADQELRAGP